MSMPNNWEKTSFPDYVRYYAENESGSFCCDENGMLLYFEPKENNCLHRGPFGFRMSNERKCLRNLIIPEGVRTIDFSAEDLRDLIVVEKLVFPGTIEKLDEGVLSGCLIMEMELPETLQEIGPGALMCSYIHVLRIPKGMQHPRYPSWLDQGKVEGVLQVRGRQFKETIINTLIVPRDYPYKDLMVETKINQVIYSD